MAATRCQVFGAVVRPQADALGQNLPRGAISSAVEHLPYKEIFTGAIPASPISKSKPQQGVSANAEALFLFVEAFPRKIRAKQVALAELARSIAPESVCGTNRASRLTFQRELATLISGAELQIESLACWV